MRGQAPARPAAPVFRWAAPPEPAPAPLAVKAAWHTSFAAAAEAARRRKVGVLVYFTATWCAPCRWMERATFPEPEVVEALRRFEVLLVDVDAPRSARSASG